jgi:hypothetical protein
MLRPRLWSLSFLIHKNKSHAFLLATVLDDWPKALVNVINEGVRSGVTFPPVMRLGCPMREEGIVYQIIL